MKPIFTFLFCAFALSAFCQVKVGVQAGFNYTTFAGNDIEPVTDYYYHASSLLAFNVGIMSSIPLVKHLSLQPSLLLSEKGAKEKSGGGFSGHYYYTNVRLYYAHLPVQVMYTFINKKELQVAAGGGFFISKGIWGTSNTRYSTYSDSTGILIMHSNNKINYTNDLYDYGTGKRNVKPWDAGYTVAAAADWQNWQLKAAYDFGIKDILGISEYNHYHTGVFSLSAGYYFGKKKVNTHLTAKPAL